MRTPRSTPRGVDRSRSSEGWLLVAFIVVLTFVFVVLGGLVYALTEHRRYLSSQLNDARARYLAQACIMDALYDYTATGAIDPNETWTIEAGPAAGQGDDDVCIRSSAPTGPSNVICA